MSHIYFNRDKTLAKRTRGKINRVTEKGSMQYLVLKEIAEMVRRGNQDQRGAVKPGNLFKDGLPEGGKGTSLPSEGGCVRERRNVLLAAGSLLSTGDRPGRRKRQSRRGIGIVANEEPEPLPVIHVSVHDKKA